jgi:hypothetical protein
MDTKELSKCCGANKKIVSRKPQNCDWRIDAYCQKCGKPFVAQEEKRTWLDAAGQNISEVSLPNNTFIEKRLAEFDEKFWKGDFYCEDPYDGEDVEKLKSYIKESLTDLDNEWRNRIEVATRAYEKLSDLLKK